MWLTAGAHISGAMDHHSSLKGSLLVASPTLKDPNFARSVVLVLDHDANGALGLVLNRPTGTPVAEVLERWTAQVCEPRLVFSGGPVAPSAAICLAAPTHPGQDEADPEDGLTQIAPGISVLDLGQQPDVMRSSVQHLRVFAGYSGWGPSQLDNEIATGSWVVVASLPEDPFVGEPARLWESVLRRQRPGLAMLARCPSDPGLN